MLLDIALLSHHFGNLNLFVISLYEFEFATIGEEIAELVVADDDEIIDKMPYGEVCSGW